MSEVEKTVEAAESPLSEQEAPVTSDAMIDALRRYRRLKAIHEEEKSRAQAYLRQVEAEIAQDLAPLEAEIEDLRTSMQTFIVEHNRGESFRVPGLGSAFVQSRRHTKVTDEEAFIAHLRAEDLGDLEPLYDEPKLNSGRARDYARHVLTERGELLPGVESEERQTLAVRLTSKEAQ